MKSKLSFVTIFFLCAGFYLPESFAQSSQTWDVENELPMVTHVGKVSEQERKLAQEFRRGLIRSLTYWRDIGLPDPPDLEGIYHLTSYDHLKVETVLQILNPNIPDVKAHLLKQYEHLKSSELAFAREQLTSTLKAEKIPGRDWKLLLEKFDIDQIFDHYARIRYGFSVPNIAQAVQGDLMVSEVNSDGNKFMPDTDNAFYGRFPRIDLTEVLRKAKNWDLGREINMDGIVNEELLEKLLENSNFFSRRIVILPRTMEGYGDLEVSTLRDQSVGDHEQGHHLNGFLARKQGLHRLVNEVLSDYIAFAPTENPIIGQFFAEASGIVAERLRASKNPSQKDLKNAKAFEETAARGFLRDLSQVSDIDSLERFYKAANAYDGGHPIRYFLWNLRQDPRVNKDSLDAIILKVIPEFSGLPRTYSGRAQFNIIFRSGLQLAFREVIKMIELNKLRPKVDSNTKIILTSRADALAEDETVKYMKSLKDAPEWVQEIHARNLKKFFKKLKRQNPDHSDEMISESAHQQAFEATSKAVLKKIFDEKLKALRTEFRKSKDEELLPIAEEKTNEKLDRYEANRQRRNQRRARGGFQKRPAIEADYVVAEFLRTLYRTVKSEDPQLADQIRRHAQTAMNGQSIQVKTKAGTEDIVFIRTQWDKYNFLARPMAVHSIRKLERLRVQIKEEEENEEPNSEKIQRLRKQYSKALEHIHEYERTGSTFKLYFPHPVQSTLSFLGKATYAVFKKISGRSKKSDQGEDEKDSANGETVVVKKGCNDPLKRISKEK